MTLSVTLAQRAAECLLAAAFVQQALEHLASAHSERWWWLARIPFALLLIGGVAPRTCLTGLVLLALAAILRYDGPYNGGSDRMGYLILFSLWLARLAPSAFWREVALGYLATQVCLSYALSGWVKLVNPDWRSGLALRDVFAWSAYPVSVEVRRWADWPRLLWVMAWAVLLFELAFPLALLRPHWLPWALAIAATLHVANAWLFGLHRFVWVWLAGYPPLLWLQGRLLGALV